MSANSKIPEDKHLQSALYGTPKVNPDEQRRYLGTFRERVCLTVSIEELTQDEWTQGFAKEIATEQAEIIFFNGNIDQSKLRPYILTATKSGLILQLKLIQSIVPIRTTWPSSLLLKRPSMSKR